MKYWVMKLYGIFFRVCRRIIWYTNYCIRKNNLFCKSFYYRYLRKKPLTPVRLNLGCNICYMKDWINVDVDWRVKADLYINIRYLDKIFPKNSVDTILMSHVISYFSYEAAIKIFSMSYFLLKPNGKLILEFPDIKKIAKSLHEINSIDDVGIFDNYYQLLRPIFAFVPEKIIGEKKYPTYIFAWSAMHIKKELERIGFVDVKIIVPEFHGRQIYRDSRVECRK